ncbi:MAG: hypothetical protein ACRDWI_11135 [Jiangellaceae bacterium]
MGAADPGLELVGRAGGDDPAPVDHRDAVGQPVGLVDVDNPDDGFEFGAQRVLDGIKLLVRARSDMA